MAKIGKNVLENLTQAMYDDSRIVYREYIQNSSDQIDIATNNQSFPDEDLHIVIQLDKKHRNIFIEDNANGIPANEIEKRLANVADSEKIQGESKGFRGIGRLGGIGYCKELRFVTSYYGEPTQTTMIWDATRLRAIIGDSSNHDTAEQVLDKIISYEETPCDKDKHFFRVEMLGINAENDRLLDEDDVSQYISEVAPVDYTEPFWFRPDIERFVKEHADEIPPINTYKVFIRHDDGDLIEIRKNYTNHIYKVNNGHKTQVDTLNGIHADIIRDDNGQPIAWIWYAISSFKAQINAVGNPMRGLRLRQFNILIGNRETLSESPKFFKEPRGNGYFIGEVHTIANKNLRPNARRDYFNESNEVKDLEYALRKYIADNLDGLYKDGSTINSGYDKLEKYSELQKKVNEKKKKGFSSSTEETKLKKELVNAKEKAEKAIKDIVRIENKSKQSDVSALSKLVKTVTDERKIDLEKVKERLEKDVPIIEEPDSKKDKEKPKVEHKPLDKTKKKPKLLVDELSNLNKSERKLVSKIYDVIHKNMIFDEADSLIQRIQEELKKNNVS
ncbi:MAG: ATP-binding protein [Anaerovibrio sp.]|uniref:ATP-binding protein n=1 Tax=Anaerovibrio lipolyticus TaxID=82374 RepID=UPI001F38ADB1|nr:ATP-binding protein [Anaerovibrio lipolyticus]MCF2600622.1 ATP-binding protein [Anaerovibrio lipolyticus]MDY5330925.1 ATP-binding protein [Anaerovibrio sp.]